jgi:DUF1680 family protein
VEITVGVDAPASFALMLRIPGWCRSYKLTVNGKRFTAPVRKGYAQIRRRWSDGDTVRLAMAMPIERVAAHPAVAADAGKVALQQGPVVYCLEQCDHKADVQSICLPDRAKLTARFDARLLGGVAVIEGPAVAPASAGWDGKLYRPAADVKLLPTRIKAVPYCLWDNRKGGAMAVWLPRA